MNAFTAQLLAFPSLPSWNEQPETRGRKPDKRGLSAEKIERFRKAMEGHGWFLRKDLEPLMEMSRPQVNHALSKVLVPLGMVEAEWVDSLSKRYRWVS